jgi:hypothetical protein
MPSPSHLKIKTELTTTLTLPKLHLLNNKPSQKHLPLLLSIFPSLLDLSGVRHNIRSPSLPLRASGRTSRRLRNLKFRFHKLHFAQRLNAPFFRCAEICFRALAFGSPEG